MPTPLGTRPMMTAPAVVLNLLTAGTSVPLVMVWLTTRQIIIPLAVAAFLSLVSLVAVRLSGKPRKT